MDLRPIKHRLSDINRKNINLNKCITKVENAPPDYTIITAEGEFCFYYAPIKSKIITLEFEKIKAKANDFWENGDSEAEWHEITEDDKKCVLPQYTGEETPYVAPRHLPLLKTGTRFQKKRDLVEKQ